MSSEEDELLKDDKHRTEIRAELSNMSFEDLHKLKEKLGSKVYNEAMFGTRKNKNSIFKRENKNRPREISAKKQVPRFKEVVHVKKCVARDPRFDSLCGTFNEKAFNHSYSFLHEVKKNDLKALKEELNNSQDPKTIKKIKYLIQRLENQLREEKKKKLKLEQQHEEKQEIIQAIKEGGKPNFKKKSEKRILQLASQFEELKNTGKIKKHIRRVRKKNLTKERQKLELSATE
ncbi:ribosomal RNA processing protein 36 homolog isoform X2 [Belonocnema kinseyi]|uniref:ribosomal RNA processing protein 36 homolog isoform X2 n=1 Tax=Belonocnema kinseyi TaxID=2817044 RepID=UPI00143CD1B3|nr:ribosomal RNA processing protein 36 homolog isoform X2 [Belonocnema kinseyi]